MPNKTKFESNKVKLKSNNFKTLITFQYRQVDIDIKRKSTIKVCGSWFIKDVEY